MATFGTQFFSLKYYHRHLFTKFVMLKTNKWNEKILYDWSPSYVKNNTLNIWKTIDRWSYCSLWMCLLDSCPWYNAINEKLINLPYFKLVWNVVDILSPERLPELQCRLSHITRVISVLTEPTNTRIHRFVLEVKLAGWRKINAFIPMSRTTDCEIAPTWRVLDVTIGKLA